MKRIQQQAIEHYDRMIAWAEAQPQNKNYKYPLYLVMPEKFKETYDRENCDYCQKYVDCEFCKIQKSGECCDGLFEEMCDSQTWKQWIERAKKVREYIRENG